MAARPLLLSDLALQLARFDIVIASTASSLPLVGLGMVERALKARRHRPMFMVDLGVPRDIEPEVGRLDDVFLYTVDDLGHVVSTGMQKRREAAEAAEAIIAREVLIRKNIVRSRGWLYFIVVSICLAISAAYELVEWRVSIATGSKGDAFLGTQG